MTNTVQFYPLRFSVQLRLHRNVTFFGPGVANLLSLVDNTGSLNAAAGQMHMAYSKAWKVLNVAEKQLGYHLISREVGRGSTLTEKGRDFLGRYYAFESEVNIATGNLFKKYFPEAESEKV